ncbi:MAG TPA: methionyl-tRNA formyltransferase, partial [Anaerolineae bacterium]
MSTKIVFMGTPDFAVPALKALIKSEYHLVGVVTQPNRPQGRGKKLAPPPVKAVAETAGVTVLQPRTLKAEEALADLAALEPDLIVVAAFGQILRENVLALPPHGCLNVHASLLPRWRGAAPIQRAILAGDRETGVCLMRLDEGLDSGPVLARASVSVGERESAAELHDRLAELGARLLLDALPGIASGSLVAEPQPETGITHAPRLRKDEARIDWAMPAG